VTAFDVVAGLEDALQLGQAEGQAKVRVVELEADGRGGNQLVRRRIAQLDRDAVEPERLGDPDADRLEHRRARRALRELRRDRQYLLERPPVTGRGRAGLCPLHRTGRVLDDRLQDVQLLVPRTALGPGKRDVE